MVVFARNHHVIPDKPRSGADPESIVERFALRWIPALRCASAGMTQFGDEARL